MTDWSFSNAISIFHVGSIDLLTLSACNNKQQLLHTAGLEANSIGHWQGRKNADFHTRTNSKKGKQKEMHSNFFRRKKLFISQKIKSLYDFPYACIYLSMKIGRYLLRFVESVKRQKVCKAQWKSNSQH